MAPASTEVAGDPIRTALAAKLESQYRIVRLLGQGGMGSVYLARDLTLEREVAIKVIKTAGDSRELYDRFRREAKTASQFRGGFRKEPLSRLSLQRRPDGRHGGVHEVPQRAG